jgi:hypothetical protein
MTWGLPVHGGLDLLPLLDYFGADLVSGKKKSKLQCLMSQQSNKHCGMGELGDLNICKLLLTLELQGRGWS